MKRFLLDPHLNRDLSEFLLELHKHQARYLVVGGWAVMAHTGKLRATKDLDLYIAADEHNLVRTAAAMGSFGAPPELCAPDALRPQPATKFSGVHFGLPPSRIDVLTRMELAFDELEARLVLFSMAEHAIPVAARTDLMTLKRIAVADDPRRKTDKADLKALEALEPKRTSRSTRR